MERALAKFSTYGRETSFIIQCDALAVDEIGPEYHVLHIASVAGPQTSIKAAQALLTGKDRRPKLNCDAPWCDSPNSTDLYQCEVGYRTWRVRLAMDSWHLLVISNAAGLMPNFSATALWRELSKPEYTTPLLEHWMPWVAAELIQRGHLKKLTCWQCSAARLTVTTEELDSVVSDGIIGGHLTMNREAA